MSSDTKARSGEGWNTVVRRAFRLALGARMPKITGELRMPGLTGDVTIQRDELGIPYITAKTDEDAWFGLGFVHGQDRGGQLEIIVRAVRGTLAAVLGADGVPIDRLSRRIGFRRAGAAQIARTERRVVLQTEAYAAGIHQGATRGTDGLAHDFVLLGCEPTRWSAADVQGMTALLGFALAANWDAELCRLSILQRDGAPALRALETSYREDLPVCDPPGAPAGAALDRLAEDLGALQSLAGGGGGSNAWALAASRTATGRPIVANDPHLPPVLPPQWYLAKIVTPDWSVAGANFVGLPGFVAGHNGHAAWGITAAHGDNTDLFLEEIGADGRSVRHGDRFVPCELRRELVEVKGKHPIEEDVLVTPRGPLIGPIFDAQRHALSIAATWLDEAPYDGFYSMHRVRSPEDFRAVFRQNSTSGASVVYADADGRVAWQFAMNLPRRKKGHGLLPLPGWDPEVGWEAERVRPEELPFLVDPACGFVAAANNQPVPDGVGPHLGGDWLDGYRQRAISSALAARKDWDVARTLELQRDVRSIPWEEIRERVLGVHLSAPRTDDTTSALGALRAWDGRVAAESVGAAVFELFFAEMTRRIVRSRAPGSASWALGRGFHPLLPYGTMLTRRTRHTVRLLREQPPGWFPSWEAEIASALAAAWRALADRATDPADRAWGRARPLYLKHAFGQKPPLDRIFDRGPLPGFGDASTIAQGTVDALRPLDNLVGAPNLRVVVDVGAWDESRFILLGGQSGNPLSPHYDDQVAVWQRGEGAPIAWSDEAVRARARSTIVLRPPS